MKYKYLTKQDEVNVSNTVSQSKERIDNGELETVLLEVVQMLKETNLMFWNLMEDMGKTPPFNK